MSLFCIGIDHNTASLSQRENVYHNRDEIVHKVRTIAEDVSVLFTCNRVELYAYMHDEDIAQKIIAQLVYSVPALGQYGYTITNNKQVVTHMIRLAAGLLSQVVGEKQIYDQLESWVDQSVPLGRVHDIWKTVLEHAAIIRVKSGLYRAVYDIADYIIDDIAKKRITIGKKEIMIVGTGTIARLFAEKKDPRANLYFASRKKHARSRQLANMSGGKAILLDDLSQYLSHVDAVISASACPHYVLKKHTVDEVSVKRNKELFIYDIALPRNVEPTVETISGVSLKNLDDIGTVSKKSGAVAEALRAAEKMIKDEVDSSIRGVRNYAFTGRHKTK
ncbi:MAG: hypothetical protein P9M13_02570 [Candidatus Ancaeobacter aquaticus]|nr:hypothetical protein [Candidatus Ancaeobacter aquaticus]